MQPALSITPPVIYPGDPHVYRLHLHGEDKKRKVLQILQDGVPCKYHQAVSTGQCPKLYVVRNNKKEVIYVGYAHQPMSARLRYGLTPYIANGYHGYGWMNEPEVELLVWVFEPFGENKDHNDAYKRIIECIEAEVVFQVRQSTGHWPEHQQEVHFGNMARKEVLAIAEAIFNHLFI